MTSAALQTYEIRQVGSEIVLTKVEALSGLGALDIYAEQEGFAPYSAAQESLSPEEAEGLLWTIHGLRGGIMTNFEIYALPEGERSLTDREREHNLRTADVNYETGEVSISDPTERSAAERGEHKGPGNREILVHLNVTLSEGDLRPAARVADDILSAYTVGAEGAPPEIAGPMMLLTIALAEEI